VDYYQQTSICLLHFTLQHKTLVDGLEVTAALRLAAVLGVKVRMRAFSRSIWAMLPRIRARTSGSVVCIDLRLVKSYLYCVEASSVGSSSWILGHWHLDKKLTNLRLSFVLERIPLFFCPVRGSQSEK